VSAISHLGDSFSQNFRDLKVWEAAIDSGRLPLWRGLAMSADDRVRARVINQLMCQGYIEIDAIEHDFGIDFTNYFREALTRLESHIADGLVRVGTSRVVVTPAGQLLLRSVAMCFDAYLEPESPAAVAPFSRVV
jgi:oxygen-independent coproporphyrinogen-3 oxidase